MNKPNRWLEARTAMFARRRELVTLSREQLAEIARRNDDTIRDLHRELNHRQDKITTLVAIVEKHTQEILRLRALL